MRSNTITHHIVLLAILATSLLACNQPKEHTAPAIYPRDSVATMTSYGVNTLVSDSGVIKYKIFDKGLFLEQFDEKFHVQSYIQCDTAYYFDTKRLWELRGRVRILTKDGLRFSSEELYWDENEHELYSNKFSRLVTPDRQLQGSYFRSDERMTRYYVSNTKGSFEKGDIDKTPADTATAAKGSTADSSAVHPGRLPAQPKRKQ